MAELFMMGWQNLFALKSETTSIGLNFLQVKMDSLDLFEGSGNRKRNLFEGSECGAPTWGPQGGFVRLAPQSRSPAMIEALNTPLKKDPNVLAPTEQAPIPLVCHPSALSSLQYPLP